MPRDISSGRHSGLLIPLFSMPSSDSWGIGEILDIPLIASWLRAAGQDILQILPINEMAPGQRSPYSAITAMAVDPIFISLRAVGDFQNAGGEQALSSESRGALADVRAGRAVEHDRVRALKDEALRFAFARFRERELSRGTSRAATFAAYVDAQGWWLDDYAVFRTLHAAHGERSWLTWPEPVRGCEAASLGEVRRDFGEEIRFHQYSQWLADLQWRAARAASRLALFGDLPFMVDLDSADVWAHQDLFDLDASVGVPPDAFSETGQDWGLPAYRWDVMKTRGDQWLRERGRRSAALFDGYRIDHLVGFYRTYVIPHDRSPRFFRPADEADELAQGERVMGVLREPGSRIVAEDLGTVPDFVRESLARLRIPGYKVLRWERKWHDPGQPFRDPVTYPAASLATSGTHDTEPMAVWWDDASADEREKVGEIPSVRQHLDGCDLASSAFTPALRDALLEVLFASGSDLLILPIQDVFGWRERINVPATVTDENWTYRLPWAVDAMTAQPEAQDCASRLRAWSRKYRRGT